jgi:hypothetical protein
VRESTERSRYEPGFILGDHLPPFTVLLIVLSIVTKIMAAGRFKAEAKAVVATEIAESEALKRQVVEGAHGGDAGAGRAALPVQHAGLDRPPDRDRPEAREPDAEEPDRAAAGVDAGDARRPIRPRTTSAARWR